VILWT